MALIVKNEKLNETTQDFPPMITNTISNADYIHTNRLTSLGIIRSLREDMC